MRRALPRLHEVDQFVRIRLGTFARHDHGGDGLAPFVVGHADHGDHRDIGMLRQHILDLARKDVEAARDDHVLLAVEDEHVAALVLARDVAGVQPAALERFRGRVRSLPVFGHHMAGAHADLAGLAGGDFLVVIVEDLDLTGGDRESAGQKQLRRFGIVVSFAQDRHRIAFGLAVKLREHRSDPLDPFDQPAR